MVEPYRFEFIYPSEFGGRTYRFRVRVEKRRVQIEGDDLYWYLSGGMIPMSTVNDPDNETKEDAVKFFRSSIDYLLGTYAQFPKFVDMVTKSLPHEEITDWDDFTKLAYDHIVKERSSFLGEPPEQTSLNIRIIQEDLTRDSRKAPADQN